MVNSIKRVLNIVSTYPPGLPPISLPTLSQSLLSNIYTLCIGICEHSVPYAPLYKLCDISFNNYLNITKDSQIWKSKHPNIYTHMSKCLPISFYVSPYQSQKTSKLLCSLESSVSPLNCFFLHCSILSQ